MLWGAGGGAGKVGAEVRGPEGPSLSDGTGSDCLPQSAEAAESEGRGS